MRPVIRTLRLAVVLLVVAACGASTASPSPSPEAVATPTTAPTASAVPQSSATAAPSEPGASVDAGPLPAVDLEGMRTVASTGLHEIRCRDQETVCAIVMPDDGSDEPRWSVAADGPCSHLLTSGHGEAVVACDPPGGAIIHILDFDGRPRQGWPLRLDAELATVRRHDFGLGCGSDGAPIALAADGTAFVAVIETTGAELIAVKPDGTPRSGGWPIAFPVTIRSRTGSAAMAAAGSPSTTRPGGWPCGATRGSSSTSSSAPTGPCSRASTSMVASTTGGRAARSATPQRRSCAADGGLAYTSATGKVWSHGPDGEIRAGWPYVPPAGTNRSWMSAPVGAPDGHIAFTTGFGDTSQLPDPRPGWPTRQRDAADPAVAPGLLLPVRRYAMCRLIPPIFGPDETLYLVLAPPNGEDPDPTDGGSILAVTPDGDDRAGWPVALGAAKHGLAMEFDLDGNLLVDGVSCPPVGCPDGESAPLTVVIAPDGRVLATIPPD